MKKKTLRVINMLLGSAILATGVLGCKAKKAVAEETVNQQPATEEAVEPTEPQIDPGVICLYGIPPQMYQETRPMLKYGVPNPNGGGMITKPDTTQTK